MTATAVKQKPAAGIAFPVATLAVVGIAIAARAVGDSAPALLHGAVAFVSTLNIDSGFSPVVAGLVAVVLFLAGVVNRLSGFAFSAGAACQSALGCCKTCPPALAPL